MTTTNLKALFTITVTTSLILTGTANAAERVEPQWLEYERSAPTLAAAREAIANSETIDKSDNNTQSLQPSDDLLNDYSAEQRARLEKYGPWLDEFGVSINAQQLLDHIADSRAHGLNPEAYNLDHLDKLSRSLRVNLSSAVPGGSNTSTIKLRSELKKGLTDSFTRFVTHLGQGVVDARDTQRRLFRDPPSVKAEKYLENLRRGQTDVNSIITSIEPSQDEYQRLKERMRSALTELASDVPRTVLNINTDTMKIGERSPNILDLRRRLIETGDLPTHTVLTPMFDADLLLAVKSFQQRHGLEPDGAVGRQTKEMLNSTVREEITELALSLERWRWMPRDLGDRHIYVNLPSYRLTVKDGKDTAIDMRVVIGSKRNQTPLFSRDISYMQVNPTWTVPASITNQELIPKEKQQPGYLESRNFKAYRVSDGDLIEVPFSSIDPSHYERKKFPYVLRQAGGPGNALGRMKFMMPNPYAIYLHDTQAKSLFNRNDRAYSHGCIRLSEPDELAHLLLQLDGNSRRSINRALRSSTTDTLRFREHIPTHMAYITTWIDEKGELQRRKDVYNHDPALRTALFDKNTLLNTLGSPVDEDALLVAESNE